MREITITIENERVRGDGVCVGAAGSGRDVFIRARLGESWEGCDALSAQWTDARGGKSVIEILPFSREAVFPVSFAAKKYAGDVYLTLKGGKLSSGGDALLSATLSASARFTVEESLWDRESESADMPDPTVAEQLTGLITGVETDLEAHAARADNPHSVTKAQVGLGNVENKSIDSAISAHNASDSGAHTNKYDKSGGTVSGTVTIEKETGDMLILTRDAETVVGTVIISADAENDQTLKISAGAGGPVVISGVKKPTEDAAAANKAYVDDQRDAAKSGAEATAHGEIEAHKDATTAHEISQVNGLTASLAAKYSADNAPPYPVTSVAGKTGAVTLAKGDVGLGNVENKSIDAAQSAAEGYADSAVSTHNAANDAHASLFASKLDKNDGAATGLMTVENETVDGRLVVEDANGNGIILRGYTTASSKGFVFRVINDTDTRPLTDTSGSLIMNAKKTEVIFQVPIYMSSSISGNFGIALGGKRIINLAPPTSDADAATKKYVDDGDSAAAADAASKVSAHDAANGAHAALFDSKLDKANGTATGKLKVLDDSEKYGVLIESGSSTLPKVKVSSVLNGQSSSGSQILELNASGVEMKNSKKITGLPTPTNDTDAATKKYVDDAIAALRAEILGG